MTRILIIQEYEVGLQALQHMLRRTGYNHNTHLRMGGVESMSQKERDGYDLVLAGLSFEHPYDVEAYRFLRVHFPERPIIVLSVKDEAAKAVFFMQEGAQDYLVQATLHGEQLDAAIKKATVKPQRTQETTTYAAMVMPTESGDYKRLFDDAPVATIVYDGKTQHILTANEAACALYGYSLPELQLLSLPDIRTGTDSNTLTLKHPTRNTFYGSGLRRYMRKDGNPFAAQVYTLPTTYQGREARSCMIVPVQDVQHAVQPQTEALQKAMRFQQHTYEGILASLAEVVWSSRADDGKLLYINNACRQIYGHTAAALMEDNSLLQQLIHPADRQRVQQTMAELPHTGKASLEYRIAHKDGMERQVMAHVMYRPAHHNTPAVINGIALDVTHLRATEHTLKAQQKDTYAILQSITDGFYVVDQDWRFTYTNHEFEQMLYARPGTLTGQNLWTFFPEAVGTAFETEQRRALMRQESVHFEAWYAPGSQWFSVHAYPTGSGLAVYFRDVTEEKELLDKIYIDEQNLRAVINNTKARIWSVDKDLRIILANDAYKQNLYDAQPAGTRPSDALLQSLHAERLERRRPHYKKAFLGQGFTIVEKETRDGVVSYTEVSFNPIFDRDKKVVSVSCFARDVTAHRNYLQKIQTQNDTLREIAWVQSHDVRGPVASILGLAQLFNPHDPADPTNAEVLEGVMMAARQLDDVIKDIVAKAEVPELK